jgi:hypothetical protein
MENNIINIIHTLILSSYNHIPKWQQLFYHLSDWRIYADFSQTLIKCRCVERRIALSYPDEPASPIQRQRNGCLPTEPDLPIPNIELYM